MAARVVSTVLRFARRHISSFCCLLLLLLPPVRRLFLFFSPLLACTALCALALISRPGPSSEEQKNRDENIKMDEWAAVRSELECNEACNKEDNSEESSTRGLVEEEADNPCERLQEEEVLAASNECASNPSDDLHPDLRRTEGSEEGSAGVCPSEMPITPRLLAQQPLQKLQNREDEESVSSANGAAEELAGSEASPWSLHGAMEQRLPLGDAALEDSSTKNRLQNKRSAREERVIHEQQKVFSHAYEASGFISSRVTGAGRVDPLTLDQSNLVLAQYA